MANEQTIDRGMSALGLVLVCLLHAAALYGLWSHRLIPSPQEAMTLFVNFIAPCPTQAPAAAKAPAHRKTRAAPHRKT
jgi:protein TonB